MQISPSNRHYSKSDNLNLALNALKNAAQNWDSAEQKQERADRYIESADREFQWAQSPARQASFDNGRINSSFQGRQLEQNFRSGDRSINNSQYDLRAAGRDLTNTNAGIDDGLSFLSSLAQEYRESGDARLSDVQTAQRELLSSEQSFSSVERDWRSADSSLYFTKNQVSRSEFDIRQISWDRPGQDVSRYGARVSNSIHSIQSDLRRVDFDMHRAASNGNQGEGHLDRAIAILENAARHDLAAE